MCSIAGFISSKPLNNELAQRLSSALLFYGAERGDQSTGIWVDGILHKKAIKPDVFIESDEFNALFTKNVNKCLLHTRFPTCGERGDDQAQPFEQGNTVTIHNGWYTNIAELKDTWNIKKTSGVDSELATSFIDTYGIKALPSFLQTTSGVSAIATIHNDSMYLIRDGNPISYAILELSKGVKLFVFASTRRILLDALHFVFLLPSEFEVKEVLDCQLFKVTPTKLVRIGEPFESTSFKSYGNVRSIKGNGVLTSDIMPHDEWLKHWDEALESEYFDQHTADIMADKWEK